MGSKQINIRKQRVQDIRDGKISSVSSDDLKLRREQCRMCDMASKNSDSKYSMFGGLYYQSQCKAVKQLLLECLWDPEFKCPKNKFECEK